jgi:glutamine amidotransferase
MIKIVDYGLGNILAFLNVYKRLNIPIEIAKNADALSDASKIILPGVGAFDQAMDLLGRSNGEVLIAWCSRSKCRCWAFVWGANPVARAPRETRGLDRRRRRRSNLGHRRLLLPHMG